MEESLTSEQKAEILVHQIIQATKDRIINNIEPHLSKLAKGHSHFDEALLNAIITDIRNA